MRRFFFDPAQKTDDSVTLSDEESHHIRDVLRLRPGHPLELMDGKGGVYNAEIVNVTPLVSVKILSMTPLLNDSTILVVGQAMLKTKKMDLLMQKCTELGATVVTPVLSHRCQVKNEQARRGKRHERWRRISDEACKQCLRGVAMDISDPVAVHDFITAGPVTDNEQKILFWEGEKECLTHGLPPLGSCQSVKLLLGPEGGFTPEEVALAVEHGWRTVSLGRRTLRGETATIAALSIVQHLLGNM